MTANSSPRTRLIHVSQTQVLTCGTVALLLGGYAALSGWLDWAGLFRSHPLLSIPCTLSLFVAPAALYISLREISEVGVQRRVAFSALLSAGAVGLVALAVTLWLRNLTG